jgi:hypothetical protein
MVFVEGDDYRQLRRPGDDPAQFRSLVRFQRAARSIPNSVEHQYTGDNFTTSSWPDNIGNAGLSVQGPSPTTLNGSPAARGDGTDDVAISTAPVGNGPESIVTSPEFSIAFSFQFSNAQDTSIFMSFDDGSSIFDIIDFDNTPAGTLGNIILRLDARGARLSLETKQTFDDGQPHFCVVNKAGDTAAQTEIYVDDMTSPKALNVISDNFDSSNMTNNLEMGFFQRNKSPGTRFPKEYISSFFEFNSDVYTESERVAAKSQAGGV